MTSTSIIDRPEDLTIHLCSRCFRVITGPARKVSRQGVISYECIANCQADPDRACRTGETLPSRVNDPATDEPIGSTTTR